jgi:hypothetical protein
MKKLCAIAIGVLSAVLLFGCGPLNRQVETASYPSPKGWPRGDKYAKYVKSFTITPREAYLTRLVYEGESIDNWTEGLEVFNTWKKNFPPTPEKAYNMLIEKRIKMCPEAKANVISQDNNSILYEITTINCPPHPDENSLNRILYGNTDVFHFIYTNKVRTLPTEKRDDWIRVLSNTTIETIK